MTLSATLRERLKSPAFRTLAAVTGIGVLCKATALGRELLIAAEFGASPQLDAFLVAVIIPATLANVVGNVLATSLLPQLLKVRQEQGPAAELAAQQRSLFWSILLLAGIGCGFAAAGPWLLPWLSPGFGEQAGELAQRLLWAATPYGVLAGATRMYAVLAESEGKFTTTSFSPMLTAVLSMLILVIGGASPFVLAAGLTIGAVAELVYNAAALRGTRYRPMPRPGRYTAFEAGLVAVAWPLSLGSFLHGLTTIVDQSMASLGGEGAVSELMYGNRFVAVTIGLAGTPLLAYAFPLFARLVAERRFLELRRQFKRFSLLAVGVSLPPMIVLSGLAHWTVDATFQRGRFSQEVADSVALVQALGSLQIPFTIVAMLGLRCVFALKLRHVMLYQGAGTVLTNLALDYGLLKWLGTPGIALATTLVAAGTCGFMLVVVEGAIRREVRRDADAMGVENARAA